VINGATSINVTDVGNGQSYPATVVGYDRGHYIAVLQLQGASGLQTASIADSNGVAVGDEIAAIGNAGGLGGTPSIAAGTVSALNQTITVSDDTTAARRTDPGRSRRAAR
jgi:S1-C subfamily serine protease